MYKLTFSDGKVKFVCEQHYEGYSADVVVEIIDFDSSLCEKCEQELDEKLGL